MVSTQCPHEHDVQKWGQWVTDSLTQWDPPQPSPPPPTPQITSKRKEKRKKKKKRRKKGSETVLQISRNKLFAVCTKHQSMLLLVTVSVSVTPLQGHPSSGSQVTRGLNRNIIRFPVCRAWSILSWQSGQSHLNCFFSDVSIIVF